MRLLYRPTFSDLANHLYIWGDLPRGILNDLGASNFEEHAALSAWLNERGLRLWLPTDWRLRCWWKGGIGAAIYTA